MLMDWETFRLLRRQYYPKQYTESVQSLSDTNGIFLIEMEKSILKYVWNFMGPKVVKTMLKKSKVGRLPNLKTYKGVGIKQYGAGIGINK